MAARGKQWSGCTNYGRIRVIEGWVRGAGSGKSVWGQKRSRSLPRRAKHKTQNKKFRHRDSNPGILRERQV
eukprot:scaffold118478_cov62-Cyclotella_meneghiniana.AAC.1